MSFEYDNVLQPYKVIQKMYIHFQNNKIKIKTQSVSLAQYVNNSDYCCYFDIIEILLESTTLNFDR